MPGEQGPNAGPSPVPAARQEAGRLAGLRADAVRKAARLSTGLSLAALILPLATLPPIFYATSGKRMERLDANRASRTVVAGTSEIAAAPAFALGGTPTTPAFRPTETPDITIVKVKVRKGADLTAQPPTEPAPKRDDTAPSTLSPAAPPAAASSTSPTTTPVAPTQPAATAPPVVPAWTDAEVAAALKVCVALLAPLMAEVEPRPPLRENSCGTPAPLAVKRIGVDHVVVEPPALVNCAVTAALHNWLDKVAQPAARELFGSPIARLTGTGGYVCRNRNGAVSGPISEHAFANAIDISGFVLADGRSIDVLRDWGRAAHERRNASLAAGTRTAIAAGAKNVAGVGANQTTAPLSSAEQPLYLGGLASQAATQPKDTPDAKPSNETIFLKRLHAGACAIFGTVLGPEANEEHRNHLHLDMKTRNRKAFCE